MNTMYIMLSKMLNGGRIGIFWRKAPFAAILMLAMAPCLAEVAVGILDTKADGSAYLYTKRKLERSSRITLDASIERRCCWNGSGADFRQLTAREIQAVQDKPPYSNVDLEKGMFVYELLNSNYTWRDDISIAIIDADNIVRMNYPKKIIQRLGAMQAGQKYTITLFPGQEGLNLTLHRGRKLLDRLYFSQGGM